MKIIEQTLGDLVMANPAAARVLHRYRLAHCCGGRQSLDEACTAESINVEEVIRDIEAEGIRNSAPVDRWDQRPPDELVQYLLDRFHTPLRTELPRLTELAEKVERVHADRPDRPRGLTALLTEVHAAVESHLDKEEQIIIPLIVSGQGHNARMPVQVMMQEHEDHGQNLQRIRRLTADLTIPADACKSWRGLYRALAELEIELMDHIHLENNILFPPVRWPAEGERKAGLWIT